MYGHDQGTFDPLKKPYRQSFSVICFGLEKIMLKTIFLKSLVTCKFNVL